MTSVVDHEPRESGPDERVGRERAVEAAGGTINDVVAMSVFTTDVRYHRDINEVRREVLGANFPTSTMVQVVALARPELLLEINATAVIA